MSGLNIWTRTILRLANRMAGEPASEWCAAMAAETDAAGSQGLTWALGCLSAALRMRMRTDPRRTAFYVLSPIAVLLAMLPWLVAISAILRGGWIGPIGWAIMIQLPVLAILVAGTAMANRGIPWAFVIYTVAVVLGSPMVLMWLMFQVPPSAFLAQDATWLNLPRNQGLALMAMSIIGSLVLGIMFRRIGTALSA